MHRRTIPLSFSLSNYYIVNGAMKPRQPRFTETVAGGARVHASIRPAPDGISFSADKPASRTLYRPFRAVHGPRNIIPASRDHLPGVPFHDTRLSSSFFDDAIKYSRHEFFSTHKPYRNAYMYRVIQLLSFFLS